MSKIILLLVTFNQIHTAFSSVGYDLFGIKPVITQSKISEGFLTKVTARTEDSCSGCIQLEANVGTENGKCLALQTSSKIPGIKTNTCNLDNTVAHAQMKECSSQSNQCLFYDDVKEQLYDSNNRCLTILLANADDYTDACDPCAISTVVGSNQIGGMVYTRPCEDAAPDHQRWKLDNGVIQSGCPHGFYLASASPVLIVASDTNLFGTFIPTFGEEAQVSEKFPDAALEMVHQLIDETATELVVFSHGCWCAKLNGEHFGGVPIDDLDQICKDWATARKCMTLPGSTCEAYPLEPDATYTISQDKESCPWNLDTFSTPRDVTCGEFNDHFGSVTCQKDLCLIDVKYGKMIQTFMNDNPSFTAIPGNSETCPTNHSGGQRGTISGRHCVGVSPDVGIFT